MPFDTAILLILIFAGATLQVGVGIGFSIVVAPFMMIALGTATAVPVLLALNTLVSIVAVEWQLWKREKRIIKNAILGCLGGIILGVVIYPYLSEQLVLLLTAILLLFGVVTTVLKMNSTINPLGFKAVSALSGLATVWAATPGPLMVFGLLATGRSGQEVRKLVQPVALVAYGVSFALHGLSNWAVMTKVPNLLPYALVAVLGSVLGRLIGSRLPHNVITQGIRIISIVACMALFYRAYLIG